MCQKCVKEAKATDRFPFFTDLGQTALALLKGGAFRVEFERTVVQPCDGEIVERIVVEDKS